MNGDNLQSRIASILRTTKIKPIEPEAPGKPLDILHGQTEQGTVQRNGMPQSVPNVAVASTPVPAPQTPPIQAPATPPVSTTPIAPTVPTETIASMSGIKNMATNIVPNDVSSTQTQAQAAPSAIPVNNETKTFLQKPIRTYESDVAEIMSKKKTSVAKMVIAETKKETGEESISNKAPSQFGKNLLKVLVSLIFIAGGGMGGYYLYLKSPLAKQPMAKPENKIASVIPSDTQKIVQVNSLEKKEFSALISNAFTKSEVVPGKMLEIIPVKKVTAVVGDTTTDTNTPAGDVKVTAAEFLTSLDFEITDTLKRSLTDKWMLGVYSADGEKIPFILLTDNFFQNSFAGMLKWEATMPDEFADLLNYKDRAYPVDPLSTSTVASYFTIKGQFRDKIIKNRDIREFVNINGEVLLLYSFIDKDTIVISTSEAVVPILVERIEKQAYLR